MNRYIYNCIYDIVINSCTIHFMLERLDVILDSGKKPSRLTDKACIQKLNSEIYCLHAPAPQDGSCVSLDWERNSTHGDGSPFCKPWVGLCHCNTLWGLLLGQSFINSSSAPMPLSGTVLLKRKRQRCRANCLWSHAEKQWDARPGGGIRSVFGKSRELTTQGSKVSADQIAIHYVIQVIVGPKLGLQLNFKGCLWPPSIQDKKSSNINFMDLVRPVRGLVLDFWWNGDTLPASPVFWGKSAASCVLVRNLLDFDPACRLTAQEALRSPWFQKQAAWTWLDLILKSWYDIGNYGYGLTWPLILNLLWMEHCATFHFSPPLGRLVPYTSKILAGWILVNFYSLSGFEEMMARNWRVGMWLNVVECGWMWLNVIECDWMWLNWFQDFDPNS